MRGASVFALDLKVEGAEAVEGVTYLAADVASEEDIQAADTAAGSGSPTQPLRTVEQFDAPAVSFDVGDAVLPSAGLASVDDNSGWSGS